MMRLNTAHFHNIVFKTTIAIPTLTPTPVPMLMLLCGLRPTDEGRPRGDNDDRWPRGTAAEGHERLHRLPQEDDGAQHPVHDALLPRRLQRGDQKEGEEQRRQQGSGAHHLLLKVSTKRWWCFTSGKPRLFWAGYSVTALTFKYFFFPLPLFFPIIYWIYLFFIIYLL